MEIPGLILLLLKIWDIKKEPRQPKITRQPLILLLLLMKRMMQLLKKHLRHYLNIMPKNSKVLSLIIINMILTMQDYVRLKMLYRCWQIHMVLLKISFLKVLRD